MTAATAPPEPDDRTLLPPHDADAESLILGAVMKLPRVMAQLAELPVDDFYLPRHRTIWRAMLDLWSRGVGIDVGTIEAKLKSAEYARSGVTVVDLAAVDIVRSQSENVEHYARLVQNAATQRRYIDAAQKLTERAWRQGTDIDELAAFAETHITAARPRTTRRNLLDPEQWALAFEGDLEARVMGQRTAVLTGLVDVDSMTLGFESGSLILLMGTPGTGKTDLAKQIAMYVGKHHGPVLFASLEMSQTELGHRYARLSHGMDRNHLAKGQLSDDEWQTYQTVIRDMQASRVWVASPPGRYTTADLRADAMEVQTRAGKVALVVADYVQRFSDGDGQAGHREINVGMVAMGLKSLARELGCPVLAPVQPNREYASRPNKRPVLSDLRESGKLEQEADVVLGLYRDEKHDQDSEERGIAEVHMLKNRSGVGDSDGSRRLRWTGTKYGNYAPDRLRALP